MTVQDLEHSKISTVSENDEYNIPLDISDIISICREYNKLGWKIQNQIESIVENGVEESLKTGILTKESLPLIKSFLKSISRNPYFGDAVSQADDCVNIINEYEYRLKINHSSDLN